MLQKTDPRQSERQAAMRPHLRPFLGAILLAAALPACTASTPNVIGTAFPTSRMGTEARLAGVDTDGFTMRRILGRPDGVEPLREDAEFSQTVPDGRSLRELLDVEGTRSNIFDQAERGTTPPPAEAAPPPPPRRGSASPPPPRAALPEEETQPRQVAAPRPPAPAAAPGAPLPAGTVIPGPQGGTVVGGSAGSVATTVGPGGAPGTATRDGRTITLFGADGSIRTVPAPTR